MKVREKNKYYTLMVVPHDAAGHTISLRIPAYLVRGLIIIFLVSFSAFSLSLVYSAFLSGKLIHYKIVVQTSAEKDKNIEKFANETDAIKNELQEILDQNNSLRKILGLKIEKTKINLGENLNREKALGVKKISFTLKSSLDGITEVRLSLEELKKRVNYLQARLASMPTAWPVYGRIMSSYGYRRSPWRGLHTGIDIDASYGTPVRATAAGIVAEAGWKIGYGRCIIIDHGFGFSTLYAHNSKLKAAIGQKISKGQIIAYIGISGYSTGPHCHYEVRKNGYAVNPVKFLGMNILTASRYL
jgi:murein DD-endopeptidase MepM/ murein hydrolase activator NlpD